MEGNRKVGIRLVSDEKVALFERLTRMETKQDTLISSMSHLPCPKQIDKVQKLELKVAKMPWYIVLSIGALVASIAAIATTLQNI